MLIISLCNKARGQFVYFFVQDYSPISNTVCTLQPARPVAVNAGSLAPSDNNREASDGTSPDHSDNRKLEK